MHDCQCPYCMGATEADFEIERSRIMPEFECLECEWTGDYDDLGYDRNAEVECCPECFSELIEGEIKPEWGSCGPLF